MLTPSAIARATPRARAFLARASGPDRAAILHRARRVVLQPGERLVDAQAPLRLVWFPLGGAISLLARAPDSQELEVGLVGREGLLGGELLLGVDRAVSSAVVRLAGTALCLPAAEFRALLRGSPALRALVGRWLHAQLQQLAVGTACIRFRPLLARLSRMLLALGDRAPGAAFHQTQGDLARALSVRRESVTAAAHGLQSVGIIRYHRGEVTVLDRSRLAEAACACEPVPTAPPQKG